MNQNIIYDLAIIVSTISVFVSLFCYKKTSGLTKSISELLVSIADDKIQIEELRRANNANAGVLQRHDDILVERKKSIHFKTAKN